MIEMIIDSIRMSLMNYQRVVILKEKLSDRYLPIWIGQTEADAIAMKLQGVEPPRPLTHDLLRNLVKDLGAKVNYILVNDLRDDTFYLSLRIRLRVALEAPIKISSGDANRNDNQNNYRENVFVDCNHGNSIMMP